MSLLDESRHKNNSDIFILLLHSFTPPSWKQRIRWGKFLCANGRATTNASLLIFAQCFMIYGMIGNFHNSPFQDFNKNTIIWFKNII